MSRLLALKSCNTLSDVALLLGFTPGGLSYILYIAPEHDKYQKFTIPKKAGGTRNICAPTGALKQAQKNLAELLYDCREEMETGHKQKSLSFAFRRKHSIVGNAQVHKRRRYVLNLDIADFFPTFNFGRVRGFFMTNKHFALPDKVATVLAQIACFENTLPQGSPCSPVIADMITHILDVRLAQLAKKHRVTYSRYADDLTFSTSQKQFPADLASMNDDEKGGWALGSALTKVIEKCGFSINPAKTRMQVRPARQTVTGLSVNEKVNITSDYWRGVRSMCHALFKTGTYHEPLPTGVAGTGYVPKMLTSLLPLAGRLTHIHYVKRTVHQAANPESKTPAPGHTLQYRFWFYKFFVALSRPLIVCEGITDKVYLKNAIKYSTKFHPLLATMVKGECRLAVDIFNYDNKIHEILGLTGGSGVLSAFMKKYAANLKHFAHKPLLQPVIIVLDNDDGLNDIKAELKKLLGKVIDLNTKDAFYHVTHNLYIIKTPEGAKDEPTCIESGLPSAVLKTLLDGKLFNPAKKIDPDKEIGKVPFAKKVVGPKAHAIDWIGFHPLLDRIIAVMVDYAAKPKGV